MRAMKKIIILFLLISFCGGTDESFEESTGDEEIQSNDNLSFLLSSVNIYEFGEGPYNLEQCKNIGIKI